MSSILKLNPARALRCARTGLAALALGAALSFGAALAPAPILAQEAPARPQPRTEAATADATKARMVVVEWRIKKGREAEFLDYWSTRSTVPDRSGLIGEFLNRIEDRGQYPWMVWEFDPRWTTFINVRFWREGADFQEQIGRFIDNSKPPMDFEADRRRRVFMAPERWRIGETPFPAADHPGVR